MWYYYINVQISIYIWFAKTSFIHSNVNWMNGDVLRHIYIPNTSKYANVCFILYRGLVIKDNVGIFVYLNVTLIIAHFLGIAQRHEANVRNFSNAVDHSNQTLYTRCYINIFIV